MVNEILILEKITTNVKAKARKATLQGRNYLVVPGTIIKEGVLNGSKGRLYYPKAEIEKNPNDWNGMPIVGYHPIVNGKPTSARDPTVLEKHGLGHIYKTKNSNGSLKVEYWFDEELTSNFDQYLDDEHKIMPRLTNGEPIETSTGVYTTDVKAEDGATFNSEPYDFIATNYKPDHVAVLPDEVGACSIADGCGVCVNSLKEKITKAVRWIIGRDGKKEEVDTTTLNELSHSDIRYQLSIALRSNYTQNDPGCYIMEVYDDYFIYEMGMDTYSQNYSKSDVGITLDGEPTKVVRDVSYKPVDDSMMEMNMALSPTDRKAKVDYLTANCACWKNGQQVLNNLTDEQLIHIETQEKAKTPPTVPSLNEQVDALLPLLKEKLGIKDTTPVANTTPPVSPPPVAQPLTANEWLATAPAEVRAVYEDNILARNQEKANLIQILTNNVKDDASKQQLTAYFNTKDVSELRILARAYPQQTSMPIYPGAAPAINRGTPDPDEAEPLIPPTINYAEEVASRKKVG